MKGFSDSLAEALDGESSVPSLRALVVGDNANLGAEALLKSGPLPRSKGGRPCHVKSKFDPCADLVGALSSRATTRAETELKLGERDAE